MYTSGANLVVDPEVSEDVRAALRLRGETVEQETFTGTGVQMIGWERATSSVRVLAASDPRKGGFAAAL
jgi:gamma-glutamyltranspeptidase